MKDLVVIVSSLALMVLPLSAETLYDQTANGGLDQTSTQDFEAVYDTYDAEGADDFQVTWVEGWQVDQVKIIGTFWNSPSTPGPLESIHINFYTDNGGLPGAVVCSYPSSAYTDEGSDMFSVILTSPCVFGLGTYWLGIQGQMDFAAGGQFGWGIETVQTGHQGAWRNPGGGFGNGCTSWTARSGCGYGDPDYSFQIFGSACSGDCPPTGACCEASGRCVETTSASCAEIGSIYNGDGSTCAAACPTSGACCQSDGTCSSTSPLACTALGGNYQGDFSHCWASCGACCNLGGTCSDTTDQNCAATSGIFQGGGTSCASGDCNGACCQNDGSCSDVTSSSCDAASGMFRGIGTSCASGDCNGACCQNDGSCSDVTGSSCDAASGTFRGIGTSCATSSCEGACCLDNGSCTEGSRDQCATSNGAYLGDGTLCADQFCPDLIGACCQGGSCTGESSEQCAASGGLFHGVGSTCGSQACSMRPKLIASDGAVNDYFGYSVSLSSDTLVVGAPRYLSIGGAVYVFERHAGGTDMWGQTAKIPKPFTYADGLGTAVSIDGDLLVSGAVFSVSGNVDYGSAFVFARDQGGIDNWGLLAELNASVYVDDMNFGCSAAINGDTAIVGASLNSSSASSAGAAYIFGRNHGGTDTWGQITRIESSDFQSSDYFGTSVSISGDIAVVGAYGEDGPRTGTGSAYIFYRNAGGTDAWGQVTKISAPNLSADASFGWSVAIDGDVVVVGALQNNVWAGSAHVFHRHHGGADNWSEVRTLLAPDGLYLHEFGVSVAISGETIVVGAWRDDYSGTRSGSSYVFRKNEGGAENWGFVSKLIAVDGAARDYFGYSVAIDNDVVLVGARGDDIPDDDEGSAYGFADLPAIGDWVFFDGFESGDLSAWPVVVRDHAEAFNNSLVERNIDGDYILCTYNGTTGDFGYLGQIFNEADGAIGGGPIVDGLDLYWKNENLASTIEPYAQEDADADPTINGLDADAFEAAVQ